MKKLLLYMALLSCGVAQAAKVQVSWENPTENEPVCSGSPVTCAKATPLTDLAFVKVEYDGCDNTWKWAVITATTVVGAKLNTFITPTGVPKVCVRAFAYNAGGVSSKPTGIVTKDLMSSLGKPVTLGAPVILKFTSDKGD